MHVAKDMPLSLVALKGPADKFANKMHDFTKNVKFANNKWKGVISGKKYFRWFAVL